MREVMMGWCVQDWTKQNENESTEYERWRMQDWTNIITKMSLLNMRGGECRTGRTYNEK